MTASTVERLDVFQVLNPSRGTLGAAATYKALKGCIVCQDANGRASAPIAAGTAGTPAAGVASATQDNTSGANDAINIDIEYGVFEFPYTQTAPKPGATLYVVDNVTLSATQSDGTANRGVAGICTEVDTVRGTCSCAMGPHWRRAAGSTV
jgi:hypothetical protein